MNLTNITVNTQSSIRIEGSKILYFDPFQIPAYNKLKPFHTKGKKWQGYVVEMDDVRYYVAGDTDVNEDIRKVRCDVALIPIGGFYTMDWKQAAEFIAEIKPKAVIPTHYGSIVGNKTDGQDFQKMLESADKNIQVELK